MLDHFAKERYSLASSLVEDLNGEDIRELLLKITIENTRVNIFKATNSDGVIDEEEISLLDRLAKSLLLRIVFDNEVEFSLIESAALVCAQVYETLSPPLNEVIYTLEDNTYLNRVMTSLLYYVSGYDPNAKQSVSELGGRILIDESVESRLMANLIYFSQFKIRDINSIRNGNEELIQPQNIIQLKQLSRNALYYELDDCLNLIKQELINYHTSWNRDIKSKLKRLFELATDCNEQTISLISLILLVLDKVLASRAISVILPPSDCLEGVWSIHMQAYINEGVYLIWPPHKEAIDKGILNEQNNIVAIPTGTGKSLIAEHKIISSLQRGQIVIYLSPTLALCRQISGRMRKILDVQSLISGSSLLVDDLESFDELDDHETKLILVMTPEKCSTLLKNRQDIFQNVILCVVDEFHNIKEGSRGALLDSLLARLSEAAPNSTYLLLSALIDNSEILPKWLENLNHKDVQTTFTRWRPSRTIRGFIAHPQIEYNQALRNAKLSKKKTYSEEIETDLFFCVQDVWSQNERQSAYPIRIPKKFKVRFGVNNFGTWSTTGYGNDLSRQLGNWLASCNMPVLIFSQTTRHLLNEIENHSKIRTFNQVLNNKVSAYLEIAKAE
ncbi:DEAD/DEAH box helicase [Paenibacillus sp. LHD-117]|uniref:DEAD/DEAH box helicase n=1 Tax=Paenibacillus sp. LHD-117 TaxID=3071412 RepID=UPI0027E0750E|nr:DEAD/DEAH box helicase [Paenibacillus sp. LHD-117]MDQ6421383.1 DEAD/DEAH box helicase [Paenibacillus sp. LHD-117]